MAGRVQTELETGTFVSPVKSIKETTYGFNIAGGTVKPGDAETGWAKGCLWLHYDGSGDTDCVYVNVGDHTSANFDPLPTAIIADLVSVANGDGAAMVGIEDSGAFTTAVTVEAALAEIYQHLLSVQKTIAIPLTSLRETSSFDVPAVAAACGVLGSDTTPKLEAINDANDGCQRCIWAAANVDQVIFQTSFPQEFDDTADLVIYVRTSMSGGTDTPDITVDSFFNEGDAKVTDTISTISGAAYTEYSGTIATADVPAGARTVTIGLTPGAHGTDTLAISAIWLEYNAKILTS